MDIEDDQINFIHILAKKFQWFHQKKKHICFNLNITPDFMFRIKIQKYEHQQKTLQVTALLVYQNGQPVSINPIYKQFLSQIINQKQKIVNNVMEFLCIIQNQEILLLKQKLLLPIIFRQTIRMFQKPILQNLLKTSNQLENILTLIGLNKNKSKITVYINQQQNKVKEAIKSIFRGQHRPVQDNKIIIDQTPLLIQIQPIQQQKGNINSSELQKFHIRKRKCQIIKKQNLQKQTLVLAFKGEKIYGQQRLLNQFTILKCLPRASCFLNYYFISQNKNIIIMQYIKHTLRDYLLKRSISLQEIIELSIQLLKAVQVLHQNGIVHRDLKPSNFLVKCNKKKIELKIIDFSDSAIKDDPYYMKNNKKLGFTLPYSPIECSYNTKQSFNMYEIDYWSVGLLLFQIYYSKLPFKFSHTFSTDILKNWPKDFTLNICKTKKNGVRFVEDIFNIVCLRMLKIKQDNRLSVEKAIKILELTQKYVLNLSIL